MKFRELLFAALLCMAVSLGSCREDVKETKEYISNDDLAYYEENELMTTDTSEILFDYNVDELKQAANTVALKFINGISAEDTAQIKLQKVNNAQISGQLVEDSVITFNFSYLPDTEDQYFLAWRVQEELSKETFIVYYAGLLRQLDGKFYDITREEMPDLYDYVPVDGTGGFEARVSREQDRIVVEEIVGEDTPRMVQFIWWNGDWKEKI